MRKERRPWYPSLDDLRYTPILMDDMGLRCLSAESFRAVMILVSACANKMVDLQFSERNGGWISASDEDIRAICCLSDKKWAAIKPDVMKFFFIEDEKIRIANESWVEVMVGTERPPIPASIRSKVMQRDGYRCVYCGTTKGPFDIDHVVPYSRGGANDDPENLVCACGPCNSTKRAKTPEEWISGGEVPR